MTLRGVATQFSFIFALFASFAGAPLLATESCGANNRCQSIAIDPVTSISSPDFKILTAANDINTTKDSIKIKKKKKKKCPGPKCKKLTDAETAEDESTQGSTDTEIAINPVNPHGGKNNCMMCALTVEQRARGQRAIATYVEGKDKGGNSLKVLEDEFAASNADAGINPGTPKFKEIGQTSKPYVQGVEPSADEYDRKADKIRSDLKGLFKLGLRKGSRAILAARRHNANGHVFNIESRAGGVYIVDGQTDQAHQIDSPEAKKYLKDFPCKLNRNKKQR